MMSKQKNIYVLWKLCGKQATTPSSPTVRNLRPSIM